MLGRLLTRRSHALEDDLANLNAEQVKVLVSVYDFIVAAQSLIFAKNELVMSRLRHEELETELVRYKLLYVPQMLLPDPITDGSPPDTPKLCIKAKTRCPLNASR